MSDETKNKTAAETAAENIVTVAAAGTPAKNPGKGKNQAEAAADRLKTARAKAKEAVSALEATGRAACRRHGLKCVWVTEDGQCFDQESNARAHAKNLGGAAPIKVEA
jgi:hypothetical protein